MSTRTRGISRATVLHAASRGRPNTALHVTGIALVFVSVGMAICTLIELASTNRDTVAMVATTCICGALGVFLWWTTAVGAVRTRDVFAAVGWTWVLVTLVGALPYVLAGIFATPGVGGVEQVVNSIFESASGYSCTGSTAFTQTQFESAGRGLLMYRQATQWFGGMGIVVLAVAVLPFLGVGGLDLISAEAPGPSSDRLTPRVSETAKRLWLIYAGYTAAVALALFVVPGPSLYDSVAHALSTASTGGFSPYSSSIGHYDSTLVEIVIIVGMIVGGTNFALHWRAVTGDPGAHRRDSEFRAYLAILLFAALVITWFLWIDSGFGFGTSTRAGVFNAVSLGTSTGFSNATGPGTPGDFVIWAPAAQIVLLCLFVVGGSTGSTSGGIKVMRAQVLFGHTLRAVRRAELPRAVIPVKHGSHAVAEDVVSRMAGFFLLYLVLVLTGVALVTALGGGLETSIGAIMGSLGNMGPALDEAGPTASFADAFTQPARLVLAAFMVIGRLEIFPVLLMFAAPLRALNDRREQRVQV